MRQQKVYVDLACSTLSSTGKYYMYNDPPYLEPATIKTTKMAFAATMGFKF
jgi:hypothetical protein